MHRPLRSRPKNRNAHGQPRGAYTPPDNLGSSYSETVDKPPYNHRIQTLGKEATDIQTELPRTASQIPKNTGNGVATASSDRLPEHRPSLHRRTRGDNVSSGESIGRNDRQTPNAAQNPKENAHSQIATLENESGDKQQGRHVAQDNARQKRGQKRLHRRNKGIPGETEEATLSRRNISLDKRRVDEDKPPQKSHKAKPQPTAEPQHSRTTELQQILGRPLSSGHGTAH
jgi:hypothetical protein